MQTSLYVRQDVGSGNPIVLLHGIFADGTQWEKITELLKEDYRVIVVDVLGHGRSPRPKGATYGPDEHADALRRTLEQLGATVNLTIVGYSMGGAVALAYSAKYPKGIEQLYFISTPFYLTPDQMLAANYASSVFVTKVSQRFFTSIESLLGNNAFARKLVGLGDKSELFHKAIGAKDNKLDADIIRLNIEHMIRTLDFAGLLAKTAKASIPTTFYTGKKDVFIVQGQLYALKRYSPYMDIKRLDIIKVDHMLVQNLPKEIVRLITVNRQRTLNVEQDVGSGEVLVLLHGIESSASYWQHFVPSLAEHRRVIVIDLLGFGRSPRPNNIAYSLDDQVAWLRRTLRSLGVTKLALAGHSLGSLVALAYTAAYPKDVLSLTLFSPVLLPDNTESKKLTIRALRQLKYASNSSFLYAQAAKTLGDTRLSQYVPSARTVENAINQQHAQKLANRAAQVPTQFYYGTADPLVDGAFVKMIAHKFAQRTVHALPKKNHNFPMFSPDVVLRALDGDMPHKHVPAKISSKPPTFLRQISQLAVPALMAKAVSYLAAGLLLFSRYAPIALMVGLAGYVIFKGYRIIKGAFSLKNEGLSYIGYIILGALTCLIGYSLYKNPDQSLRIAIFSIIGIVLATGLLRVVAALLWTTSKGRKKTVLLSGLTLVLLGLLAVAGSIISLYVIVYTVAGYVIAKGIMYGWYALGALIMAYIRGFNKL